MCTAHGDAEQCHECDYAMQDGGGHEAAFKALLPMNCLDLATEAAEQLDTPDIWRELAEAAVHVKDVGLAAR